MQATQAKRTKVKARVGPPQWSRQLLVGTPTEIAKRLLGQVTTKRAADPRRSLNSKTPSESKGKKKRIRKESPPSLLKTGDEENHMQNEYASKETKMQDSKANG